MKDKTDPLEQYIRTNHATHDSVEDQVRLADLLYDENVTYGGSEKTQKEIEALVKKRKLDLDHEVGTILDNLCNFEKAEFDVVEKAFPPGPETFVISERLDDVINGRIDEIVENDREALIDHIQEDDPVTDEDDSSAVADGAGTSLRTIVADGLDVAPDNVEHDLRSGDAFDQVGKLDDAINAIEESDDGSKRDDYGRITFRHVAYRYRMTERAVQRKEEDVDE